MAWRHGGKAMARVRGEVNADFLPITSDRTGFIRDSSEYQEFLEDHGKDNGRGKNISSEIDC